MVRCWKKLADLKTNFCQQRTILFKLRVNTTYTTFNYFNYIIRKYGTAMLKNYFIEN